MNAEQRKVIEQLRERAREERGFAGRSKPYGEAANLGFARASAFTEAANLIEQALPADTELDAERRVGGEDRVEKVAKWLWDRMRATQNPAKWPSWGELVGGEPFKAEYQATARELLALPTDAELQVERERVEKVAEWLYQRFSFGAVGASLEASAQATRFRNLARELLALIAPAPQADGLLPDPKLTPKEAEALLYPPLQVHGNPTAASADAKLRTALSANDQEQGEQK